jgi:hypothetical protein
LENKPLRNSLALVSAIAVVAASEMYPEFNEWLQLVPMPPIVRIKLLGAMAVDFGGCLLIEHLCERFLFDARPRVQ